VLTELISTISLLENSQGRELSGIDYHNKKNHHASADQMHDFEEEYYSGRGLRSNRDIG
jgi:hypothetical protein